MRNRGVIEILSMQMYEGSICAEHTRVGCDNVYYWWSMMRFKNWKNGEVGEVMEREQGKGVLKFWVCRSMRLVNKQNILEWLAILSISCLEPWDLVVGNWCSGWRYLSIWRRRPIWILTIWTGMGSECPHPHKIPSVNLYCLHTNYNVYESGENKIG